MIFDFTTKRHLRRDFPNFFPNRLFSERSLLKSTIKWKWTFSNVSPKQKVWAIVIILNCFFCLFFLMFAKRCSKRKLFWKISEKFQGNVQKRRNFQKNGRSFCTLKKWTLHKRFPRNFVKIFFIKIPMKNFSKSSMHVNVAKVGGAYIH